MNFGKKRRGAATLAKVILAILFVTAIIMARAQAVRYLGSVTAINGDTLTVKTDAGDVHQVQFPSTAQLKRIAPGQIDLNKAEPLEFSGLATGDRVLVTLDPNSTGDTQQAARIIAIKEADVVKKQEAEAAEWAQGVHGLVKSIDAASGVIVVNTRQGAVTKAVTVNTTKATVLERYAPGSVRFDEAKAAPIDAVHPGDQIFARGTKSADGAAIAADGVVSGTFRSIAGTILSTNPAGSTVTVKDLATKKPATVHIAPEAQLRRLDETMATRIAARLKGNQAGGGRPGMAGGNGSGRGMQRANGQAGPGGMGGGSGAPGGMAAGDLESILDRAPQIQLSGLQKGEAVMIVATDDSSGTNAIKLLAGVEPLLEAPEAQNLLASWSLNQGGAEAAQ